MDQTEDNLKLQGKELEVLKAHYGDLLKTERGIDSYSIGIAPDVTLFFALNKDYPSKQPPSFRIVCPRLTPDQSKRIDIEFAELQKEHVAAPILYQWVEKLQEITKKTEVILVPYTKEYIFRLSRQRKLKEMENNLKLQCEELEVLNAIYGDLWKLEPGRDAYSISINSDVTLYITLNKDYPAKSTPGYTILAPTLSSELKDRIDDEFGRMQMLNLGNPIIYQWIEKLREMTQEAEPQVEPDPKILEDSNKTETKPTKLFLDHHLTHGPTIQDRKSTFQGHTTKVKSLEDTRLVMDILLKNKKISQATHNIFAYRITQPNGVILQDCEDDGEAHAGNRLLHLLQILNLTDVIVVVSRWYGGVQLGPDRFKHINNAARQVLSDAGFIK